MRIKIFQKADGTAPLIEWLDGLPQKVQDKCTAVIEKLSESGHKLRRPTCDILRDDIWELRIKHMKVHYRILYFFHGNTVIVLTNGTIKQKRVKEADINRAIRYRGQYIADPQKHTHKERI